MKQIISKIVSLTRISILGGYIQFGLGYGPDQMWTTNNVRYSSFSIALGFFTIELWANSKSIKQFNVLLNGTSHVLELNLDYKTFYHNSRIKERGNWNHKTDLIYCWAEGRRYRKRF
jgi:hypothetical protein